jgi:hypothetical protein
LLSTHRCAKGAGKSAAIGNIELSCYGRNLCVSSRPEVRGECSMMLQHPYWKPVHPRRLTTLLLYLISSRQTPLGTRVPWTPRCCALHMRTAVRSFRFRIIESRFMRDEQGALRGVFRSGHLAPAEFRTADTAPPHQT